MDGFTCGKLRWLYLLALAQLVGGPLVLLQVTWFCKATMDLAPKCGLKQAALVAWQDTEERIDFTADPVPLKKNKAPDDVQSGKTKMPPTFWQAPVICLPNHEVQYAVFWLSRVWTPAWPQAPPGPPPRLG